MNNQINVNFQGVQDVGELVTYFQIIQSGKNYLFYSKNESGPNNITKLYVCEEINPQIMSNGIQNDLDIIKNIMSKIVKNQYTGVVNFLPYKNNINVNSKKPIGIDVSVFDKLKSSYYEKMGVIKNDVTPGDILNQNFGGNLNLEQQIQAPVEFGINEVPKNFDMEKTSANLDSIPSIMPLPEMPKIEPIIPEMNNISEDVSKTSQNSFQDVPEVKNSFNVSPGNNVFDNPSSNEFGITNEEINKPINGVSNDVSFENNDNNNVLSIDNDLVDAEIAMNDKEINLYKSRIEFLESKNKFLLSKKNNKTNNLDLSNTASSLFDNNGINEKVLTNVPEFNKAA